MELRRYLAILRSRWLLIVVTALVGAGAGYLTTSHTNTYSASSTVYIGSRVLIGGADTGGLNISTDRQVALADVSRSFAFMIDSVSTARDAIDTTAVTRSPVQVVAETTVTPQTSQLLIISVTDREPAIAQKLADGMADAFVSKVQQLEPTTTEGSLPFLPAYKFQSAALPVVPLGSDLNKNVVLGAVFGLLMSCSAAFILDYVDLTVRSSDDAERRFGLPVLGVIPMLNSGMSPAGVRVRPLQPASAVETTRRA
ncbi:MAG: protein tyrosine kinase modulator [Acidimicrobiaceae bacterium]|jgi:capsular polysaccharide biosynthesis protein